MSRVSDCIVLLVLAGLVVLYGYDAYSASTDILNLILVIPVIATVLVLCVAQFVVELRQANTETPVRDSIVDTAPVISLFTFYVLTLEWLGFDIGTAVFVGAFLWLQGERRMRWLFGYSISLGFGLAMFFSAMLPYPMPMLILQTAY